MKRLLPALIVTLLLVLGVGSFLLIRSRAKSTEPTTDNRRQIINALSFDQRPFVVLFPHSSGKLITLLLDKPPATDSITVDIEYLSGNALKGGRTSLTLPTSLPYTQAFLLGSCSSGGKCSFDTDITTGTVKSKLEVNGETHVLKSNYAFVNGLTYTSDQKLKFEPKGKLPGQLILAQTHGYLSELEGELATEPVALTSDTAGKISGTLTLTAPGATRALIYTGSTYQEIDSTKNGDQLVIDLSHSPVGQDVTIIRDDLKGAEEQTTLYLLGPIVLLK